MLSPNKKYLLVDKHFRRYSAPVDFRSGFSKSITSEESENESRKSKISVIDLSVLFENQSGSDSSLELDTSISRNESPSLAESMHQFHVVLPSECYERRGVAGRQRHRSWIHLLSWPTWRTVMTLQVLSLSASFINVIIEKMGRPLSVNATIFVQYLVLAIVWSSQLALREGRGGLVQVLRRSGLRYMFLAFFHVEASTLALLTLTHPTNVGNQMIDCVAASLSLIIAYVCLEVEFQQTHLTGFLVVFLGSMGMCAVVPLGDDVEEAVWGDLMRLGCGIFLCLKSLAEEVIVKTIDPVEYLGMVGLIGCFICATQTIATDKGKTWPKEIVFWCYLLTLSGLQFLYSSLSPKILREVGAIGMHLSLITSPFYFQIVKYGLAQPTAEFGLLVLFSYALIIGGSYIYALKRTFISKHYFYPVRVTLPRNES